MPTVDEVAGGLLLAILYKSQNQSGAEICCSNVTCPPQNASASLAILGMFSIIHLRGTMTAPGPHFSRPVRIRLLHAATATILSATVTTTVHAERPPHPPAPLQHTFRHVGTFHVPDNLLANEEPTLVTSAEIVDVSRDGQTLLYTDSPGSRLGFIDIHDAHEPKAAGALDVGGEPTSVAVAGRYALVGVNRSPDYLNPAGELLVVNIKRRSIVKRFTLAGQPDSVAVSPDGRFAAIAIENERDEDLDDGLLPQLPAGTLQVLDLSHKPAQWKLHTIDLTGLAEIGASDPEPEFVDINAENLAVVTLQENNHLVVVDLVSKAIISHFSAGSATADDVDATEEEVGPQEANLMELDSTITRRREPDAVAWIDHDTFVTANEGDYEDATGEEGGSRGFTLFNIDGHVEYESGSSFEHEIVRAGHFPENRAGNKGNEPEGAEVATFGDRKLLFIGSERGNAVGVYDVTTGTPEFVQLLPTGIGPEGIKAIGQRNLLAVSAEVDGLDDGFALRSIVTIYEFAPGPASYPMLKSADEGAAPIPWTALSGMTADTHDDRILWAVSDSFLAQAFIYRIAVDQQPAVIEQRIPVGLADGLLDLEGIAARPDGGFWLASEGRLDARPNQLLQVDGDGLILSRVQLPAALNGYMTNNGLEGVAVSGCGDDEVLWVTVQREWADDEQGFVKIGRYHVQSATWTFARYPLDPVESPAGGWVGLSEITLLQDGNLLLVERDDQAAREARIKRLYTVDPSQVEFRPYGQALQTLTKRLYRDLLPVLSAHSLTIEEKVEGLSQTKDGRLFICTDNDGVDENYGETLFLELN